MKPTFERRFSHHCTFQNTHTCTALCFPYRSTCGILQAADAYKQEYTYANVISHTSTRPMEHKYENTFRQRVHTSALQVSHIEASEYLEEKAAKSRQGAPEKEKEASKPRVERSVETSEGKRTRRTQRAHAPASHGRKQQTRNAASRVHHVVHPIPIKHPIPSHHLNQHHLYVESTS